MKRLVAAALLALLPAATLAACTPQYRAWCAFHPEQCAARARAVAAYKARPKPPADKFRHAISDPGLARLRECESSGNYRAVNPTGTYRGAYQFSRATWNGVARAHYPHLVGVDPAAASRADQDRMARALWATGGRSHWPVCGYRV